MDQKLIDDFGYVASYVSISTVYVATDLPLMTKIMRNRSPLLILPNRNLTIIVNRIYTQLDLSS